MTRDEIGRTPTPKLRAAFGHLSSQAARRRRLCGSPAFSFFDEARCPRKQPAPATSAWLGCLLSRLRVGAPDLIPSEQGRGEAGREP
jgi:hypothetical protein